MGRGVGACRKAPHSGILEPSFEGSFVACLRDFAGLCGSRTASRCRQGTFENVGLA